MVLMVLVAIATIQLIAPGVGDTWFGSSYAPDGWAYSERGVYLLTELIPVLASMAVGVWFWWLGRTTRAQVAAGVTAEATIPE